MTKTRTRSGERFLITPSLLNSWGYIWNCEDNVREAESDKVCLEDKIADAREKALEDFKRTLRREPSEPNKWMQMGIDFEAECYAGNTCISPIIEGGAFQIVGKEEATIDGVDFLLYGRLDVLKGGVIYDIKRVGRYAPRKYAKSYQHGFYLELFKDAKKFEYLAYDGKDLHTETYYRDQCRDTKDAISQFLRWLKANGLAETYFDKWASKH